MFCRKLIVLWILFLGTTLSLPGIVESVYAQVIIKDTGDITGVVSDTGVWSNKHPRWQRDVILKGHEGHAYLMRRIQIDTGASRYGLLYEYCCDSSHQGTRTKTFSNLLTMDMPGLQNWSSTGSFFDVLCDGESLGEKQASFKVFGSGEDKGGVEISWGSDNKVVTARFTAQSQDVKLPVDILFPKDAFNTLDICLRCYPNEYAAPWAKGADVRNRHIATAKRDMAADKNKAAKVALANDEPWVVYYDSALDKGVARTSADGKASWLGSGPCALAYIPEEVKAANIILDNYNIDTILSYSTGLPEAHVILWDYGFGPSSKSNQEVIDYFKSMKIE